MTPTPSVPEADRPAAPYDVEAVRAQVPALHQPVHGRPLAYLDNAATPLKPRPVIDAIRDFYERDGANIHRGVHLLSQRATERFESARRRVARHLNAASPREVIFVRGTTEALNLVAESWARPRLREGDDVLVTELEHHANLLPWLRLCERTGARLRVVPLQPDGSVCLEDFHRLLGPRTRVAAFAHVSNALGTVLPVAEMVAAAREVGALTVIDGAQALPHGLVDVQGLGCDFYAFSGHKVYGPTGVGVLYGRLDRLKEAEPYQVGGGMIREVTLQGARYASPPARFEAGTPHVAGTVGLAAALDWFAGLVPRRVAHWEEGLLRAARRALGAMPGVHLVGTAEPAAAVLSFVVEGVHPHDVGTILDAEGVAVRVGHHCAQPTMRAMKVPATVRASFAAYNTPEDVERLAAAVRRAQETFR